MLQCQKNGSIIFSKSVKKIEILKITAYIIEQDGNLSNKGNAYNDFVNPGKRSEAEVRERQGRDSPA